MHICAFDWDEKNDNHIAEHGVAIFEVEEAILFRKPLYHYYRKKKGVR